MVHGEVKEHFASVKVKHPSLGCEFICEILSLRENKGGDPNTPVQTGLGGIIHQPDVVVPFGDCTVTGQVLYGPWGDVMLLP